MRFVAALLLTLLVSCSVQERNSNNRRNSVDLGSSSFANWASHISKINDTYCQTCHSGAISGRLNLKEESAWLDNATEIIRRVQTDAKGQSFSMPPASDITDEYRQLVVTWLRGELEKKGKAGNVSDPEDRGLGNQTLYLSADLVFDMTTSSYWIGGDSEFMGNHGKTYKLDFAKNTATFVVPPLVENSADMHMFTLPDRNLYLLRGKQLGFASPAAGQDSALVFEIDGKSMDVPDEFAMGSGAKMIGAAQKGAILARVDKALIVRNDSGKFASLQVDLPQESFGNKVPIGAGVCIDNGGYWFVTNDGLRVLQSVAVDGRQIFGWRSIPLSLKDASGTQIQPTAVAMALKCSPEISPVVTTPILALSNNSTYATHNSAALGTLNWATDIASIANAKCVSCHATFNEEAKWKSSRDAIIARIKISNKANGTTMPPAGSQQQQSITDDERSKLVRWLLQ